MANWHDIHDEIRLHESSHAAKAAATIDIIRRKHLKNLRRITGRNTIAYYSSFLTKPNLNGIDINDDDKNAFMTCINGMDRSLGLDLIIHTPGGGIAATESLAFYLREMFGRNIRAIVPQIAMSAGTMLALSCREILVGKQSSLGPIDPQIGGIPAEVVVTEFQRAYDEIKADPLRANVWAPILGRYTPSFLTQCEYAVEWSKTFVETSLKANMFADEPDPVSMAKDVVKNLTDSSVNKAHDRHIHYDKLFELGIKLVKMEDDQKLQDGVLSVHHCFVHTMASTSVLKIVENDEGRAAVRHVAAQPNR